MILVTAAAAFPERAFLVLRGELSLGMRGLLLVSPLLRQLLLPLNLLCPGLYLTDRFGLDGHFVRLVLSIYLSVCLYNTSSVSAAVEFLACPVKLTTTTTINSSLPFVRCYSSIALLLLSTHHSSSHTAAQQR